MKGSRELLLKAIRRFGPVVFGLLLLTDNILADTIRIGNQVEPKDLDPQLISGIQEEHLINQLFEGLYMKDPNTLKPVPGVAESYSISPDGRVYTFKLRENARWSDGTELNANDFVYSWRRLASAKTGSEYAHHAWLLKNGKAFYDGKILDPAELGVEAKDPRTLVVTLEEPVFYFIDLLEHYSMMPVPKTAIDTKGTQWTKPENFVSNGPYALAKWDSYKTIGLKKNPHYWDKEKVTIDEALIYPIEDSATEELMFRSDQLDVTSSVPVEKIPSWQKDTTGVFKNYPYYSIYFFRLNTKRPPLNDVRVRQALSLAIDRTEMANLVLKGGQLPATCYTPPKAGEGYDCKGLFPAKADIKKAKLLLAEAGFPNGKGFPKNVELIFNTMDIHKKIAEAVQQMWKKNLGIEIKITNMEWKVLLSNVAAGDYSIARGSWTGDFLDPVTFLNLWQSENGKNQTGYRDTQYDEWLALAAKERNRIKRAELLRKAEQRAAESVPAIPLYVYSRSYLIRKEVKGWYPNILGKWYLKYVSLEQKKMKGDGIRPKE